MSEKNTFPEKSPGAENEPNIYFYTWLSILDLAHTRIQCQTILYVNTLPNCTLSLDIAEIFFV